MGSWQATCSWPFVDARRTASAKAGKQHRARPLFSTSALCGIKVFPCLRCARCSRAGLLNHTNGHYCRNRIYLSKRKPRHVPPPPHEQVAGKIDGFPAYIDPCDAASLFSESGQDASQSAPDFQHVAVAVEFQICSFGQKRDVIIPARNCLLFKVAFGISVSELHGDRFCDKVSKISVTTHPLSFLHQYKNWDSTMNNCGDFWGNHYLCERDLFDPFPTNI